MALADALHGLLRLPGATYSCVVERDTGRVLAEAGSGEGGVGDAEGVVPYSVPRWGTAVAAMLDATSGDQLDDVMITSRRSYHLLRALGPTASVLVYLRLDRSRSNLAAARRELATIRWGAVNATAGPSPAAPSARRDDPAQSALDPGTGARAQARASRLAALPRASDTALPRTSGAASPSEARASRPADAARSRAAVVAAARIPAALPPTGTPARGLPATGRAEGVESGSSGVASESGGSRAGQPADPAPGPQIPLPRRSPTQRTAAQRSATQRATQRSVPRSSEGASRRRGGRGAGVAAEASAVPDGFAMPAVLGQSWAKDPGTLRRLIAGLRRLS